jgi:hypothetical protein
MTDGGKTGSRPQAAESPPHPFEDIAAPPLRLTPRPEPRRVVPFPQAERAAPPARPAEAAGPLVAEKPMPPGPEAIRALPHQPKSSGSRREVGLALLVGLAIAAAIVAAAVFFRPEPTATAAGPVPAQGLEVAATPVSDVIVQLRLPASLEAARVEELRSALAAAGFARVEVETLSTPIGDARIEYAAPQDQAAAETLAEALSPLAGGALAARQSPEASGLPAGRIGLWIVQ